MMKVPMTVAGAEKLKQELHRLKTVERQRTSQRAQLSAMNTPSMIVGIPIRWTATLKGC